MARKRTRFPVPVSARVIHQAPPRGLIPWVPAHPGDEPDYLTPMWGQDCSATIRVRVQRQSG